MFPYPDPSQAAPALRSQLDAQAGFLAQYSQRCCDLFERLSVLHLQLARQAIMDTIDTGRELAACTDPFQLGATAMHRLQPAGERLRDYQHQLLGLLAESQAQLARPAAELLQPPRTAAERVPQ